MPTLLLAAGGLTAVACTEQDKSAAAEHRFATHERCTACHRDMRDEAGDDVSVGLDWSGTMMANAARDPYWLAAVRREVRDLPDLAAVIEDKCARCHTPMAQETAAGLGTQLPLFDRGALHTSHPDHALAIDGVSCTVCHQIQPDGLGTEASFSGGWQIDRETPWGERALYGPDGTSDALAEQMRRSSGYLPVVGDHLKESALCASCHTLLTPVVDDTGAVVAEFPEQTAFLEWQASDLADTTSCQGCHMAPAVGAVRIANTGGEPRPGFRRHRFVGGNSYVPRLLAAHRDALGVTASDAALEATAQAAEALLSSRAARLTLEARRAGGTASLAVTVQALAGHKVPTGFPSRRIWLHVRITDDASNVLFESGAPLADGSIEGNDNDRDPLVYEPHYETITAPDQVQIYEAIMSDVSGNVTTALLRAGSYLKDNRLLPGGFSAPSDDPLIGVWGDAAADPDFGPGGDTVRYEVSVGSATGALRVQVSLLYQVIGYRWAMSYAGLDSLETDQFVRWYEETPNLPVVLATADATM